jgi:L-cysteine desulfidase
VNNIGSSKYSNEQILNYIKPNTPSNIQVTRDNNRIIISWLPDTNEIIIERKKLEDENFNKIANIKSAHSYIDSINIEEGQSYVYRLKAYNGALYSDYSEEKTVSFSTLLFNEKSNIDVKITPNPTSGTIDVNSNLQYSDYKLVIYTIFGTKIFEQDIKTNTYSVDLGKLSDGVYIVSLIFEKSQLTQKLIIKK